MLRYGTVVATSSAVADTTNRPADTPTDFRYWEALERPGVRRLRAISRRVLGFDPCPPDAAARMLCEDLRAGDPAAERFVDEVLFGPAGPRAGRHLLDRALAEGIDAVHDPPEAMRALFAEFEPVPDWVDCDLVEEGARIWRRWGTSLFAFAGAETLEMYTESAVAVPLSLAGGYAGDAALRRFLETVRFWIDVSEPGDLFRIGSDGRATAMRVRVMHVSVRRRVAEHPEWDAGRWGLPISQTYMLLTLMGGSVAPGLGLWAAGYQTSPREIRALLHYQRYLGYLLGVRPRFYPETVRESLQVLGLAVLSRSYTAGPHGAELIESFPRAFEPTSRTDLRGRYDYAAIAALIALTMSPNTRARHDVPPVFPWIGLLPARFPLIAATELARRFVPGAEPALDRSQRRRRERWYQRHMRGREVVFEAASGLRR